MARPKKDNRWNDVDGGSAFVIPYTLLRHENFRRLSAHGVKLILDLARQYTGFNNGYLCPSWSLMKGHGWHGSQKLNEALRECEHYRLLVRTQQGWLNKPNLVALTWRRIDEKQGHPLMVRPTLKPSDAWKDVQPDFVFVPIPRRKHGRKAVRREAA